MAFIIVYESIKPCAFLLKWWPPSALPDTTQFVSRGEMEDLHHTDAMMSLPA